MSQIHKFQEHDFNDGFQTKNSILQITPYQPEAIFIGTYNHGWEWNPSDFFYGRGMYMWTILANLFLNDNNTYFRCRTANNNIPTIDEIFEICRRGKISFADLVKGVKKNIPYAEENESSVIVNNSFNWCAQKPYSDKNLDFMGSNDWLDNNVDAICTYINNTKSIKHVYFTFKSGGWTAQKLIELKGCLRKDVSVCSIFTPTGSGFRKNLAHPFEERAWSLAHCWVWNGLNNPIPITKTGYGHLNHNWLEKNNVNPNNF